MRSAAEVFLKDESGATAIEYGLIASIVSLAIIAGLTSIGTQLKSNYTKIGTGLTLK
jgi:pilus assembly protein Flp/PilA